MGGLGIVNVIDPSSAQDVATKNYVDTAAGSSTLAALTDVLLTTPGSGQVLEYNGTKWVNHSPAYSDLSGTPQLPITLTNASHKWLNSYDASTGLFTQTRPDYSDLTSTPTLAQTLANASHKWLNSYDATTGLFTQTQPAYTDLTGTPTLAQTKAAITSNWLRSYDASTGLFTASQPAYTDITGTPQLPVTKTAVTSNWLRSYDSTTGLFTASQPTYTDLTGTPTLAQTLANASHKWLNSYNATTGLFTQTQPAAADLSDGTIGSGVVVLATSPTLVTPILGVAAATSLTTSLITTPSTQLKLQETGDSLGSINFYLRNRSGSNGGILENPSVCLSDFGFQTSAIITNIAIDGSNNLTVTAAFASGASSLPSVGQKVTLSGLTTATFLNAQVVTIATISTIQFTATFSHALYVSAPDTGLAVAQINLRAEFRNDHVSTLNPNGEIQFLDPTTGTPWVTSGMGSTSLTGQLVVTNGDSGRLPSTITGRAFSANTAIALGSGSGRAYGVIGVARGSGDVAGDRAYGGWFYGNAQNQTSTEVGIHAEVTDTGGMPAEFYTAGTQMASIKGTGMSIGINANSQCRDTLQLLADAPRLYYGVGAAHHNFKISVQDSFSDTLEIDIGGGSQADPTADTYTTIAKFTSGLVSVIGGLSLTGLLSTYNNISTVSNGVPSEYATVDLTAQGATIATTTLYAVPASGAGQYRLSWDAKITTVAGTSTTLGPLTIVYTDPDGVAITLTAVAQISAGTIATSSSVNSTSTVLLGLPITLNCKASTNITYAFAYASNAAGVMKFNLHIKLEAL